MRARSGRLYALCMRRPTPRELTHALAVVAAALFGVALNRANVAGVPAGELVIALALLGLIGALHQARQPPPLGLVLVAAVALADPVPSAVALPLLVALFLVALSCERQVTVLAGGGVFVVMAAVLVGSQRLAIDRDVARLVPWTVAIGLATAAGSTCMRGATSSTRCGRALSRPSASRTCSRIRPWRMSACGSRGNCMTSSRTGSA